MKRIPSLLVLLPACVSLCSAVELTDTVSAGRVFIDTDSKAFSIISKSTRLDMLDYAKAGTEYNAINEMFGNSSITAYSDTCINVAISAASSAQVFTLPTDKGGMAAIIYTVGCNAPDSQIDFYSSALQPLKTTKYFNPPLLKDFLLPQYKNDKQLLNSLTGAIPFIALEYKYDPSGQALTVTLSLKELVSKEDYEKYSQYLHSLLQYRWNGKKFKQSGK
ncbi:MAG: DUF3256 family protein [Prevotella sp.]|nr:DUF3256 family protein [Prevotella sp.]MCM1075490.1 DUF3256 family protein [Ruminococcus sp.]